MSKASSSAVQPVSLGVCNHGAAYACGRAAPCRTPNPAPCSRCPRTPAPLSASSCPAHLPPHRLLEHEHLPHASRGLGGEDGAPQPAPAHQVRQGAKVGGVGVRQQQRFDAGQHAGVADRSREQEAFSWLKTASRDIRWAVCGVCCMFACVARGEGTGLRWGFPETRTPIPLYGL